VADQSAGPRGRHKLNGWKLRSHEPRQDAEQSKVYPGLLDRYKAGALSGPKGRI
jgi:hypothetical protein